MAAGPRVRAPALDRRRQLRLSLAGRALADCPRAVVRAARADRGNARAARDSELLRHESDSAIGGFAQRVERHRHTRIRPRDRRPPEHRGPLPWRSHRALGSATLHA